MSGDSAPPPPETFKMPNQTQAAGNAYSAIGGLESMPNYPKAAYDAFAPNATSMISQPTGYNPATTTAMGNSISGLPNEYLPFARDLFAQGFDVNGQAYGRAAHNLTEQIRAGQAARGIQTTPYGAGLENEAMGNFNIDWENERLNRGIQTLGAVLPAYGQAGQQMGYGQSVAQMGPQFQGNMADLLGQVGARSYDLPQQSIGDWLNYTNTGNQANAVTAQNYASQIQAYKAQQETQAAMYDAIGTAVGGAAGAAPFL